MRGVSQARSGRLFLHLVACACTAAGCTKGTEEGRTRSAPTEWVDVDIDSLPKLLSEEVQRIGSSEDLRVGFTWIGDVAVAAEGEVLVGENQEREIRIYNAEGELLRTIGGPGEGPGEFRSLMDLGVRGDTVWVSDPLNGRLTLLSLEGRVLQTVPYLGGQVVEAGGERLRVIPRRALAGGLFASSLYDPTEGMSDVDSVRVPALVFNAEGRVVDTAGSHFRPGRRAGVVVHNFGLMLPSLFDHWPLRFSFNTDTVAVARELPRSGEPTFFTVIRWTAEGDTTQRTRVHFVPRPVAPDDYTDATLFLNGDPPVAPSEVRQAVQERLDPPKYHPPVTDYRVGDDGAAWLRREDQSGPAVEWLVSHADGQPWGTVTLPRTLRIRWVSERAAWVVERDELDVPWLVKIELREQGS